MSTAPLTWLFTAVFRDGSRIVQDPDDRSSADPDHGSAFTDVLARAGELVGFGLKNGDEAVSVDLITGNFVVNGRPITIHDQHFNPEKHDLRLIYFRETRVERDLDKDGKPVADRHFVNRYFIGWQTTAADKNVQHTLAVG